MNTVTSVEERESVVWVVDVKVAQLLDELVQVKIQSKDDHLHRALVLVQTHSHGGLSAHLITIYLTSNTKAAENKQISSALIQTPSSSPKQRYSD